MIRKKLVALFLGIFFIGGSMGIVQAQDLDRSPAPSTLLSYMVDHSDQYSIIIKAIRSTRLEHLFEGKGPVTVFAPSSRAFETIPGITIYNLLQPEHVDSLKGILTYHIVAGNWSLEALKQKIKEGGGDFSLPTVGGKGNLDFVMKDGAVLVRDAMGMVAMLPIPNMLNNGTLYVIEKVLLY